MRTVKPIAATMTTLSQFQVFCRQNTDAVPQGFAIRPGFYYWGFHAVQNVAYMAFRAWEYTYLVPGYMMWTTMAVRNRDNELLLRRQGSQASLRAAPLNVLPVHAINNVFDRHQQRLRWHG